MKCVKSQFERDECDTDAATKADSMADALHIIWAVGELLGARCALRALRRTAQKLNKKVYKKICLPRVDRLMAASCIASTGGSPSLKDRRRETAHWSGWRPIGPRTACFPT